MVDFKTTDDASTKAAKLKALDDRIDKLFAAGAQTMYDTPMCEMLHIIESESPLIPIDSQTPTVFLLLTNEDEESKLMGNIAGGTYSTLNANIDCHKMTTSKRVTIAQPYPYWGKRQFYTFNVTADFT